MPVSQAQSSQSRQISGTAIAYFECTKCGEKLSADVPQTLCPKDAGSLYVRYDLEPVKRDIRRQDFATREPSMWRYRDVLPAVTPVTLGEGFTPMLRSKRNPNVWIKEE